MTIPSATYIESALAELQQLKVPAIEQQVKELREVVVHKLTLLDAPLADLETGYLLGLETARVCQSMGLKI